MTRFTGTRILRALDMVEEDRGDWRGQVVSELLERFASYAAGLWF